mmetsp:Transcript_9776/g.9538  ORF Transcript_9776/g.9538 Transcript_9776/m.9538 type:complete len:500 (-) Transcript_9776:391-1890(-)|eukprot:CAMPEP_0119037574 /NCGR_PEP_ID=MMETSP1177-20130426/6012_1 /TAXON_ID=2985 /ORGANISM="Ochromonas sp, Strain CCMP1899" /LENGTH=499 /DNA_ID=CAMNT_0006999039 /DNA_START=117 /DNA_END=1616 /DNA_ORIENTATION=+
MMVLRCRGFLSLIFDLYIISVLSSAYIKNPKISSSARFDVTLLDRKFSSSVKPQNAFVITIICTGLLLGFNNKCHAATSQAIKQTSTTSNQQSSGWELSRQKRTAAINLLQDKGAIKIDTDDSGNQFLKLPWLIDQRLPYKSLTTAQRLQNEVCAGAIGELSKDVLLHAVDTLKTRKQAQKKGATLVLENSTDHSINSAMETFKDLYSGFPIVLASSIPQGGMFFLVKKGFVELLNLVPYIPSVLSSAISIGFATMTYWLFRTPTEVIKTQVQTGQISSCQEAIEVAKGSDTNGIFSLWKYYKVMLSLDIPFQIFNFILFGFVSEAVVNAGFETSIVSRLFCGISCGMITAAITCPIDVCKTRIISRDKNKKSVLAERDDDGVVVSEEDELIMMEWLYRTEREINPSTLSNQQLIEPDKVLDIASDDDYRHDNSMKELTPIQQNNVVDELFKITEEEGLATLFLGIKQRLLYVGLSNGIRLAAYGTSRMDLIMKSLDVL